MTSQKRVWVAATLDTKCEEAEYLCDLLKATGLAVALADLSTLETPATTAGSIEGYLRLSPADIAEHHPQGKDAVFTPGDRRTQLLP